MSIGKTFLNWCASIPSPIVMMLESAPFYPVFLLSLMAKECIPSFFFEFTVG